MINVALILLAGLQGKPTAFTVKNAEALVTEFVRQSQIGLGEQYTSSSYKREGPYSTNVFLFQYFKSSPRTDRTTNHIIVVDIDDFHREIGWLTDADAKTWADRNPGRQPAQLEKDEINLRIIRCQNLSKSYVLPRFKTKMLPAVAMSSEQAWWAKIPAVVVGYQFLFEGIPLIDVQDGIQVTFHLESCTFIQYRYSKRAKVKIAKPKVTKERGRQIAFDAYKTLKAKAEKGQVELAAPANPKVTRLAYVVPTNLYGYQPKFAPWLPEAELAWAVRFGEFNLYVSAVSGQVIGGRRAE